MGWLTVIAVALALGTDAFSLALGMGLTGLRRRNALVFPLIVAVFHVFMPLIGMSAGHLLGEIIGQIANLLGGAVLVFIGGRTVYKSLFKQPAENYSFASARLIFNQRNKVTGTSLTSLFVLATGVSLDALSVGFSLGTLETPLLAAVLTMGLVAGLMTGCGLILGKRLGDWLGTRAETIGGLILLAIGLKIMW